MQCFLIFFSSLLGISLFAELNSWPQWRGPSRDGQGISSIHFLEDMEKTLPLKIWESIEIPSQDDGGFGSVISDGKRAYLSVVWHRDEPTEERILNSQVMRKLGLRKLNLPTELKEKAEKDRLSLNPRLRGSKLDKWINQWIGENLNQKQKMTQGALITSRFKQGKLAIPLWVIDQCSIMNRVFASQREFDQWLGEQGFPDEIREKISQDIPTPKRWQTMSCWPSTCRLGNNVGKQVYREYHPGVLLLQHPALQIKKYLQSEEPLILALADNGKLL